MTGRRGGTADTRADILSAARRLFVTGYADVSLRAVAREAGVDPALVVQYFGGKDGLFMATMADAIRPAENLPGIVRPDGSSETGDHGGPANHGNPRTGRLLAAWFFSLWDDEATRQPFQAMLVSAASHPGAADLLREFVTSEVIPRITPKPRRSKDRLRATLAGSHLIGTALARYVYCIPPLCDAPLTTVLDLVGETLDRYLEPGG